MWIKSYIFRALLSLRKETNIARTIFVPSLNSAAREEDQYILATECLLYYNECDEGAGVVSA